ncbi:hypothetical protein, partial, partial [Absidia glauca]
SDLEIPLVTLDDDYTLDPTILDNVPLEAAMDEEPTEVIVAKQQGQETLMDSDTSCDEEARGRALGKKGGIVGLAGPSENIQVPTVDDRGVPLVTAGSKRRKKRHNPYSVKLRH